MLRHRCQCIVGNGVNKRDNCKSHGKAHNQRISLYISADERSARIKFQRIQRQSDVEAVIEEIRAARTRAKPVTQEEIRAWRDEGRPN